MKRKILKSVFYAICVTIIIITSLSSCRGGGAKGAAAAAAAHAFNEIVNEYESSESETGSGQVVFRGTANRGPCNIDSHNCERYIPGEKGYCNNCFPYECTAGKHQPVD